MSKKKKEVVSSEVPENIDTTQAELEHLDLSEEQNHDEGFVEKPKSKSQLQKEEIQKAEEKEKELQQKWRSSNEWKDSVEKPCYFEMNQYMDMVIAKKSFGCVVNSRGGTGKTYTAITKLKKAGVKFGYLDSFTTPAGLYIFLYENRNADVLLLDDVIGMFEDKKCLSYLKSALWETDGMRVVNNQSSANLKNRYGQILENNFEFNSRIIFLTNYLNIKNPHIKALLTRVNYVEVNVPSKQMLEIMEIIVQKDYENLSLAERKEVFGFIKSTVEESSQDLNLRTLIKAFKLFQHVKDTKQKPEVWTALVKLMLKKDEKIEFLKQAVNNAETVDAQLAKYNELTGEEVSRSTFMNMKRNHGLTRGYETESPEVQQSA